MKIANPPSIILNLVVLFIIISGGAVFQGYKQFRNSLDEALLSDRIVARMTAMVFQEHSQATIEILESYASRSLFASNVKNRNVAGMHRHLADLKRNNSEIDLTFVTDDKGILLANYPIFQDVIGNDLSDRNWYKGVNSNWMPYLSTVFQLIVDDKPLAATVAVPVFDKNGEVVGILANADRLSSIDQLFKPLHVDMNETISLIDQAGHIAYSNKNSNIDRIAVYPLLAEVEKAAGEEKTLAIIDQNDGEGKKYLGIAPTEIGWTVVVERSLRDTIQAESSRLIRTAIIAILLFLLIAAFILYQNSLHEKALALLQLERQLRQSEKRYKELIDNIPDILYSFSEEQSDNYYSPQVESVLGYTAEYLRAHPTLWHDSIHPDHLPEVEQAIQGAKGGRKVELEYRIYDILGQCHWLADRMTSITDERGKTLIAGLASDITDRKTAEEALQKSREKYQSLVANMLDGFAYCQVVYDCQERPVDLLYLEVNDAFALLTGLQDVEGKKYSELYPATHEAIRGLLDHYSRVALTGISEKFEWYFEPLSLWLDISVASHEKGCILVVFNDITNRKLLASQRQAALNLLQNIADRVPGVVFQCRLDGNGSFSFPFVSQGLLETYRLSPDEARKDAVRIFAVHHPDDRDDVIASLQKSARDLTPWTHEYRLKLADGTERWMSGSAMPQREEDGSTLWHGVITDVTERRQVEDALRESEARFSTAAKVARFGVYSYDFSGALAYYSPECLALFGLPPGTQLELDEDLVAKAFHPDDKPAFLQKMRAALDPCGPGTLEHEYRVIRTDGVVRWLRVIGKTVFSGNTAGDRPIHANGIIQDITERKQAEEQLRIINDELERRVEQRTRELQEAQAHYLHAEKLSAIGKLSASIAHEFNSPLQAVMTVLKGLKRSVKLEEEEGKLLQAAIDESERMKSLIWSLRDFNRPSSGKKMLMDVHATINSLLLLCKSDFSRRRITTVLNYADRLPQIMAIPDQIKQVFLNLLNNASDAFLDKEGVITISTRQVENRVAVSIQDTGIGISPEKIDLIFQPFYTTKPEVKGTGLGLSVCHGIVQNHRGEILVESQPGAGSTFTVLLPISEESLPDVQ